MSDLKLLEKIYNSERRLRDCEPIWIKILPGKLVAGFVLIFVISIGATALFGPSHAQTENQKLIFLFFVSKLADVRNMARLSEFPFATAMSFSGSIILSFVSAIMVCFSAMAVSQIRKIDSEDRFFKRLIYAIAGMIMVLMPIFFELNVVESQKSFRFFSKVASNRLILFLWVEGAFLLYWGIWVFLLLELTDFVKYCTKGRLR